MTQPITGSKNLRISLRSKCANRGGDNQYREAKCICNKSVLISPRKANKEPQENTPKKRYRRSRACPMWSKSAQRWRPGSCHSQSLRASKKQIAVDQPPANYCPPCPAPKVVTQGSRIQQRAISTVQQGTKNYVRFCLMI